jgi:hypothetical protein
MQTQILLRLIISSALLAAAGCLQVKTRIRLEPDGSGTITERVRFSKRLLDLSANAGKDLALPPLLAREAVLERMKHMGKGITLQSHKLLKHEDGSQESVAVFRIPDLADFRYASPCVRDGGYAYRTRMRVRLWGVTREACRGRIRPGDIGIRFEPAGNGRKPPRTKRRPKDGPPPPGPTPKQLQLWRELQPVARDLMKGFKVHVVFECYARWHICGRYRPYKEDIRDFDVVRFDADREMDAHDYRFVENEEIMLGVLRGQLDSDLIQRHLAGWEDNKTLPRLFRRVDVYFPPSRPLFDRYIKGRTVVCRRFGKKENDYKTVLTFDQVGFKGKPRKTGK